MRAADLGDHAEIMGDEQNRRAMALPQALDQLQHLALHGDVERRGRLVRDHQAGSQANAIAISTRWRMPPEISCG